MVQCVLNMHEALVWILGPKEKKEKRKRMQNKHMNNTEIRKNANKQMFPKMVCKIHL